MKTMKDFTRNARVLATMPKGGASRTPRLAMLMAALFTAMLAFSLSWAVAPEPAFAQSGAYVFDEQSLFSDAEFSDLESQAAELAEKYGMGVYFLTTDYMSGLSDPTSSQRTSYATGYYKEHKLGLNKSEGATIGDGVMFVVASRSRDYVTIAYGQGSYSFSDKGIEAMEDDVTDKLHDDDWYGAAQAYYRDAGSQLGYYDRHGSPQEPLDLFDWILRIALVLGVPGLITWHFVRRWRSEMKTAVQQSEAGNYLNRESVVLTRSHDQFINTTLVATPRPKDNDSGGGGGWGGGGGGGFSSSGGGKF